MEKKSPFYTASVALVAYFVIFLTLKFLMEKQTIDFKGALFGAVIFWVVIFAVHQFLKRRYSD